MKTKKIELLSPAKDAEVGIAAINHGADAVYIGGPSFGAREKASNSIADIERLCRHAALYDAKVYVTLNTLLYNSELERARQLAYDCWNAGVDALIVQDMQLLDLDLPPIPLHASTQCDNLTLERVQQLEQLGFSQVVLGRELSLKEIRAIREKTTVPLEFFVHGALCVSHSGQCYLSQYIGNRSANRGACAQPCRLPYDLLDAEGNVLIKNRHLLCLKDLNNSAHLEELMDAGITSFKIEGRMKEADYVKNVTAFYRQKMDEIFERRAEYMQSSCRDAARHVSTVACNRPHGAHRGAKIYRNYDIEWQKQVEASTGNRKIAIDLVLAETETGYEMMAVCRDANNRVSTNVTSEKITANNPDKATENIRKKALQWGDTPFNPINLELQFAEPRLIPASVIGEMKRQLVEKLINAMIENHRINRECRDVTCNVSTTIPMADPDAIPDHLMTCHHCIRFANGMCLKQSAVETRHGTSLQIRHGDHTFRLEFDCRHCLMYVCPLEND